MTLTVPGPVRPTATLSEKAPFDVTFVVRSVAPPPAGAPRRSGRRRRARLRRSGRRRRRRHLGRASSTHGVERDAAPARGVLACM